MKREDQVEKYLNLKRISAMRSRTKISEEAGEKILRPFYPEGVEIEELEYESTMNSYHTCDFIYDRESKNRPLLVYVHGGGWTVGSKELRRGQLTTFAERGFLVCNLNYSLCPEQRHPTQIREIYRCIEFALSKAEEYDIDTSSVFLAGDSAGAHLISLATVCKNNMELSRIVDYKFKFNFEISAIAPICGIFNFHTVLSCKFKDMKKFIRAYGGCKIKKFLASERAYMESPIYFAQDFPPTYIVMGEGDKLKKESEQLVCALAENRKEFRLFISRGRVSFHVFTIMFTAENSQKCLGEIAEFFLEKRGK